MRYHPILYILFPNNKGLKSPFWNVQEQTMPGLQVACFFSLLHSRMENVMTLQEKVLLQIIQCHDIWSHSELPLVILIAKIKKTNIKKKLLQNISFKLIILYLYTYIHFLKQILKKNLSKVFFVKIMINTASDNGEKQKQDSWNCANCSFEEGRWSIRTSYLWKSKWKNESGSGLSAPFSALWIVNFGSEQLTHSKLDSNKAK